MRGATNLEQLLSFTQAFQSTRPMRGATQATARPPPRGRCFNPRAPCGARPTATTPTALSVSFNPRAPCGARRRCERLACNRAVVSIHAPHAGRDKGASRACSRTSSFNPRAPCGARLLFVRPFWTGRCFNPRAPCGARLAFSVALSMPSTFQSTRPMRGATSRRSVRRCSCRCFNPRAPCGARRRVLRGSSRQRRFNPRAPCGARP